MDIEINKYLIKDLTNIVIGYIPKELPFLKDIEDLFSTYKYGNRDEFYRNFIKKKFINIEMSKKCKIHINKIESPMYPRYKCYCNGENSPIMQFIVIKNHKIYEEELKKRIFNSNLITKKFKRKRIIKKRYIYNGERVKQRVKRIFNSRYNKHS